MFFIEIVHPSLSNSTQTRMSGILTGYYRGNTGCFVQNATITTALRVRFSDPNSAFLPSSSRHLTESQGKNSAGHSWCHVWKRGIFQWSVLIQDVGVTHIEYRIIDRWPDKGMESACWFVWTGQTSVRPRLSAPASVSNAHLAEQIVSP